MTTATTAKTDTAKTDTKPATRGRKPGQTVNRPDTSALDLNFLAAAQPASTAVASAVQPRQERSPQQKTMDGVVEKAHAAWVAKERPAAWGKMPVVTYFLDPTQVEGVKYLIRKAGDFHGYTIRFGSAGVRVTSEIISKSNGQLNESHLGKEIVSFVAKDKRERKPDTAAK